MLVVLAEVDCRAYLNAHGVYPQEFFMSLDDLKQHMPFYTDVDLMIMFAGMVRFHKRNISEYIYEIKQEQQEGISNVNNLCVISDTTLPKVTEYYKYTVEPVHARLHNGWNCVKGEDFTNPLQPFKGVTVKCNVHPYYEHRTLQVSEIVQKEMDLINVIQVPDLSDLKRKRGLAIGNKVMGHEAVNA